MIEAIYKTKDYYINEYPQKRFKGKTAGQIRREAFESQSPIHCTIQPNLKHMKFWERIKELQLQGSI